MRASILVLSAFILFSCSTEEKKKKPFDATGVWQSAVPWDNNKITLTVRPDSVMLFKAEKSFCPGTKFFVSVGKWRIDQDSLLVMEPFTDGRRYEIKDLFPELVQTQKDCMNVMSLDLSAKLIIDSLHLYDIEKDGKKSKARYYNRISDL